MKTARINYDEWKSEMIKRYGEREKFEFVCPVCKFPQTVKQCEEAGAGRGEIGFSCIGRHVPDFAVEEIFSIDHIRKEDKKPIYIEIHTCHRVFSFDVDEVEIIK